MVDRLPDDCPIVGDLANQGIHLSSLAIGTLDWRGRQPFAPSFNSSSPHYRKQIEDMSTLANVRLGCTGWQTRCSSARISL